ncbi:MAG: pilin [Patescibacteria group bacterium]
MFKKRKFLLTFLITLTIGLGINFVLAEERQLETDYPSAGGFTLETVGGTSIPNYVKYIFNFAVGIVGLVAFGMIIAGGIGYLTSSGNPGKLKQAKDRIFSAILGAIILLSSYIILTTINPQLVVFKTGGIMASLPVATTTPNALNQINSSIHVELPPGPIIEERIFAPSKLARIKSISDETLSTATSSVENIEELESLVKEGCKCEDESIIPCPCENTDGCVLVGEEDCAQYDETDPDECLLPITVYRCEKSEEMEDPCKCPGCGGANSDPCSSVRGEIEEVKEKDHSNIETFLLLQKKTKEKIRQLDIEIDELKKSLQLMNDCPLWGIVSMDEFLSMKDYYAKNDWKLKKIPYWEDINAKRNAATFYCSIGGTNEAFIDTNAGITSSDLEEISEGFNEYMENAGSSTDPTLSCFQPIPIGEVFDEAATTAYKLVGKLEELLEKNEQAVIDIDNVHQSISQCTAANCSAECECNLKEDNACICEKPERCSGTPCSVDTGPIKETAKAIEKIREEIYKIIDGEWPPILDDLNETKKTIPLCTSDNTEAPSWLLLDCERTVGNLNLGGKKIDDVEKCKCKNSGTDQNGKSCAGVFDNLKEYECQVFKGEGNDPINTCYIYNFYCCRAKE